MLYLNKSGLTKYGIDNFDSFAANFGEVVSNIEIDPTGTGYRLNKRFAKFINIPELVKLFRQVADVVNIQDLETLNIPKRIDGQAIVTTVYPTPEMEDYIDSLVARAKDLADKKVTDLSVDNMLKITNEGRCLAVSPRLVGIQQDSPKLKAIAKDVKDIYMKYNGENGTIVGTQLLFSDLGTPKDDGSYNIYSELKEHCIAEGVPEEEIKFIHDAKTTDQRTKLIEDFNNAKFRVLIGSTPLMGN